MNCKEIKFTRHSIQQMFKRKISIDAVKKVIEIGRIIEDYPNDVPFPSMLMMNTLSGKPIHVVVSRNHLEEICVIITVNYPNPGRWNANFDKRIKL